MKAVLKKGSPFSFSRIHLLQARAVAYDLDMSSPAKASPPRPDFADVPAPRRRNLASVMAKDTKPEMIVRRLLHAMGYRYRLHRADLPGKPDIVLSGRRVVVEVRGCFWHRHPDPACKNAVLPQTRSEWWLAKLVRNVERDTDNQAKLEASGWRVLVIWECEIRRDPAELATRLREFLGPAGKTSKLTA